MPQSAILPPPPLFISQTVHTPLTAPPEETTEYVAHIEGSVRMFWSILFWSIYTCCLTTHWTPPGRGHKGKALSGLSLTRRFHSCGRLTCMCLFFELHSSVTATTQGFGRSMYLLLQRGDNCCAICTLARGMRRTPSAIRTQGKALHTRLGASVQSLCVHCEVGSLFFADSLSFQRNARK